MCVYTTISVSVYYDLYVSILPSLCVYTTVSMSQTRFHIYMCEKLSHLASGVIPCAYEISAEFLFREMGEPRTKSNPNWDFQSDKDWRSPRESEIQNVGGQVRSIFNKSILWTGKVKITNSLVMLPWYEKVEDSVTRLSYFWKVSVKKIPLKGAQNFLDYF